MRFKTASSPHQGLNSHTARIMQKVMLALLPGTLLYVWFFGWGVVINLLLASVTALATESLILLLRKRPVMPAIGDYSALLTAWLLALALPNLAPWWIPVLGSVFALGLGKHLYGGLGQNPFNPAMVGYVILLISFPLEMTYWASPNGITPTMLNFVEHFQWSLSGQLPEQIQLDAISSATPLDTLRDHLRQGSDVTSAMASSIFGPLAGLGWQWIALAYAFGGLWLIQQKVIGWQVPIAMLLAMAVISSLFYLIDSDHYASPLFHLVSGGAILGAFYIATDPVSGSTTPLGKLIFGAAVGLLTYVIRTWGGYPDGVAFAVLIMNMCVPLLDYYTQPRVFGQGKYKA